MKERRARKDMRITHTAAMMKQPKAASPKGEENGLSIQRKAESDHAERGVKEGKETEREKNRGSERD